MYAEPCSGQRQVILASEADPAAALGFRPLSGSRLPVARAAPVLILMVAVWVAVTCAALAAMVPVEPEVPKEAGSARAVAEAMRSFAAGAAAVVAT